MDLFDCRYYSLTRKFLILIGQWPYQKVSARILRGVILIFTAITGLAALVIGVFVNGSICFYYYTMIAEVKFAKAWTSPPNMTLLTDVIAMYISAVICGLKYITIPIQEKKIKLLIETMESDWNCLNNKNELKIAHECAENGRKYKSFVAIYLFSGASVAVILVALQPLFDVIISRNETFEKVTLFPGEYFVDPDKFFYPILLHMSAIAYISIMVIVATDTMYITVVYHACGMFKIVSHRLEHAFDKCKQDEGNKCDMYKETHVRIADAVEYHHAVTKYIRLIISTYEVPLFLIIVLVYIDISITLCCTALSLGNLAEMLPLLIFAAVQALHTLIVLYPGQKVVDDSSLIPLKAYSGHWYIAPFKLQTLVLPVLQRGTKPTTLCLLGMIVITMEFYANALQLSLSYFTALLSFR